MKKSLVITALAVAVLTVVPSCTGKDNLVTNPILTNVILENLPKEAKGFIDQHFGTYEMRTLRKASHVQDNGTFYTCLISETKSNNLLTGEIELKFDPNGLWVEIEHKVDGKTLPKSLLNVLPIPILQYLQKHHPEQGIHEVERKAFGYKLELTNEKELLFDRGGEPLADSSKDESVGGAGTVVFPSEVELFLKTHFPEYKTAFVKRNTEEGKSVFKVYIRKSYHESFKISFTSHGDWTEIEGNDTGVPAVPVSVLGLLPKTVSEQLAKDYSYHYVTSLEVKQTSYKLELTSDLELYFDRTGKLLHVYKDDSSDSHTTSDHAMEYTTAIQMLPQVSKDFITKYFPNTLIREVKKFVGEYSRLYEVELTNDVEISFDSYGQWLEIDGDDNPLPEVVVLLLPQNVLEYVRTRKQIGTITGIKRLTSCYEVEGILLGTNSEVTVSYRD